MEKREYTAEEKKEITYRFNKFKEFKAEFGRDLALFYCCMMFDVPYLPDVAKMDGIKGWQTYAEYIEAHDLDRYAGETLGFLDGETSVKTVLATSRDEAQRWENEWGIGSEENRYSNNDYKRLDELFLTYSARLVSSGGMDEQQEDTIRSCCKMRLLADKCLAQGTKDSVNMAKSLNSMVQENLSSENLRKKDAKPIDTAKIDGIIDALTRKYGVSVEMSYDDAMGMFYKWLRSHRYPETLDAAEQMLLAIINTTRSNDDLPLMDYLPETTELEDLFGEYSDRPNADEEAAFKELGLVKWGAKKERKDDSHLGLKDWEVCDG